MGGKETQKTDSKADKFYFSHTGYILIGAGRGLRGVTLSLGNAPVPRSRIDWVNSSAGRSDQNGLLGTDAQDL